MQQTSTTDRSRWICTLARARPARLTELWEQAEDLPGYRVLRQPEVGLVMVRGRVGGQGDRFNLGEMTVTRCAVRLDSGETGLSYLSGRDRRGAEIAAVLDAMMQAAQWQPQASPILAVLEHDHAERRRITLRRREATRVDFFTMTRSREQK